MKKFLSFPLLAGGLFFMFNIFFGSNIESKSIINLNNLVAEAQTKINFRDIKNLPQESNLKIAIERLVEEGVLLDSSRFFYPNENVSSEFFWNTLIFYAGLNPDDEIFDLDIEIDEENVEPIGLLLRKGLESIKINQKKWVFRLEVIEKILEIKDIPEPKRVSPEFRKKISGVSLKANYLPKLEAAFASKILNELDINPFRPYGPITRKDFVLWLWRFLDHGEKKSTIRTNTYKSISERHYKKTTKTRTQTKTPQIQIIPLESGSSSSDPFVSKIASEIKPVINSLKLIFKMFVFVFYELETRGIFYEDLSDEELNEALEVGLEATVKKIGNITGDKYSSYIKNKKAQDYKQGLDGKFEGIGAYVELIDGKFTITSPIIGSPAEKSGILAGDIVISVDDESIDGKPISESIEMIKGPAGTKVKLSILREEENLDITVTRGKITIPSIELKWQDGIPIIGLHQFTHETKKLFGDLVNEILPENPVGLIIDLRNNPGGFLNSAVDVGEFFVDRGDVIFSVEYKKNGSQEYKSTRRGEFFGFDNIVVIQNKGSASASEILASMLQDYGIAKVVGTKSLGKGTVQEISNLTNGGILKLTIAKWFSPKKRWIHENGIEPDIEIPDPTLEEKKNKIDKQLDKAIEIILQ